jgi:hypothetical protein
MNSRAFPIRTAAAIAAIVTIASMAAAVQSPPDIDPSRFVPAVTNAFFPLPPGHTFHYRGTKDGVPTTNDTEVTNQIKMILDVPCTVVHDRAYENGLLVEDAFDWYAQDLDGNVWYFGEDTREFDVDGNVISTEGSWEAGVDDADPGIVMEGSPRNSDHYRQELARNVAEDSASVLSLDESVCVDYGCFDGVLLTKETSRLEPGAVEYKYYASGVGFGRGDDQGREREHGAHRHHALVFEPSPCDAGVRRCRPPISSRGLPAKPPPAPRG